jgi:hypothetical protein
MYAADRVDGSRQGSRPGRPGGLAAAAVRSQPGRAGSGRRAHRLLSESQAVKQQRSTLAGSTRCSISVDEKSTSRPASGSTSSGAARGQG